MICRSRCPQTFPSEMIRTKTTVPYSRLPIEGEWEQAPLKGILCHPGSTLGGTKLLKVSVRHGYPWVPIDKAHGRPRQVGSAYQKTRRPVSGPNRPLW
jgi:hypothetical protein